MSLLDNTVSFFVRNATTHERISPKSPKIEYARTTISGMHPSVANLYEVWFDGDSKTARIIMEGMVKGDLEGILVPRISIDEYVPKDKDDNVVVGLFIKNAPEAVEPLRLYCDKCAGVDVTDSGDSDTLVNTSIVYVEFPSDFEVKYLFRMLKEVAHLGNMEPTEMALKFPHMEKMIPYSDEAAGAYFLAKALGNSKKQEII